VDTFGGEEHAMKHIASLLVVGAGLAVSALAQAPAQTVRNLQSAYLAEAKATSFYRKCAQRAGREGYPEMAKLFRAAAVSEEIHRGNHLRALRQIGAPVPRLKPSTEVPGSTRENLAASAADERQECRVMYPDYYRTAQQENVPSAMRTFRFAQGAERAHAQLFQRAYNRFGRRPPPPSEYFVCQTCGMTVAGVVPAVCPTCRGSGLNYKRIE
jgi:rubrerythrin